LDGMYGDRALRRWVIRQYHFHCILRSIYKYFKTKAAFLSFGL
jgi:hypothetical protein